MSKDKIFIQIGATRDGLDPYLTCAKKYELKTFLIETPAYLSLRKDLNRKPFDKEIAIDNPADHNEVIKTLESYKNDIVLILAGFECYSSATYCIAEKLRVSPCRDASDKFNPLNKDQQRIRLKSTDANIKQPNFFFSYHQLSGFLEKNIIRYPCVVKPVDGGGGLGVYLVKDQSALLAAIHYIKKLNNYNGSSFKDILIEEYIVGNEFSLQGYCHKGISTILSGCKKIIQIIEEKEFVNTKSFREAAHIAVPANKIDNELHAFAQQCVKAFGYDTGAFHIDLIINEQGIHFIEMGYRLSGGSIVELVHKITGINWAEKVFSMYLEQDQLLNYDQRNGLDSCLGLMTLRNPIHLQIAQELLQKEQEVNIDIQLIPVNGEILSKSKKLHSSLASDLLRHGSSIAKVWFDANSIIRVESLMRECLEVT